MDRKATSRIVRNGLIIACVLWLLATLLHYGNLVNSSQQEYVVSEHDVVQLPSNPIFLPLVGPSTHSANYYYLMERGSPFLALVWDDLAHPTAAHAIMVLIAAVWVLVRWRRGAAQASEE